MLDGKYRANTTSSRVIHVIFVNFLYRFFKELSNILGNNQQKYYFFQKCFKSHVDISITIESSPHQVICTLRTTTISVNSIQNQKNQKKKQKSQFIGKWKEITFVYTLS